MKRMITLTFILGCAVLLPAQSRNMLEIVDVELNDLRMAGFTLESSKSIDIEAVGSGEDIDVDKSKYMMGDPNHMFAYAWIINAKSRELVWRMTFNNTRKYRNIQFARTFNEELSLPAGEYEVYYSAREPDYIYFDDGFFSLGKFFNKLFNDEKWYDESQQEWHIRITNVDGVLDRTSVLKYHSALKQQSVVSMTGLQDSEFRQEGFNLKERGQFQIYAIGETYSSENFDYGWIVSAETSEKIWESLPDKGTYAGGAEKNQMWRETISLEPGSYWVYYVMDDSHSPDNWNANPPYDPDFYGITVSGVPGRFNPNSVEPLIKQKVTPIVELTRLGDDEFVQEGFKLSVSMQVRIYAVGEGRGGQMFDYGWILDMKTGEKVWQMNYRRTRPAGGADKNRLVDEVITLAAGSYMVYFVTDDSHSYRDWNATPPYNPSNWGITVYPADPKFNQANIEKLQEAALAENIVAQIIRVNDGRIYQERFELEKTATVRVYAIGEGDWDEMYDFGWIENANTGQKTWEMKYDKTRWAGGAKKNRKVDQIIQLPAGRYILFYKTDGSHSFNDWNDDPPDDPFHYGISLYRME